jgi:hypothetical protein
MNECTTDYWVKRTGATVLDENSVAVVRSCELLLLFVASSDMVFRISRLRTLTTSSALRARKDIHGYLQDFCKCRDSDSRARKMSTSCECGIFLLQRFHTHERN